MQVTAPTNCVAHLLIATTDAISLPLILGSETCTFSRSFTTVLDRLHHEEQC